jgi:hypothetical protein
LDDLLTVDDHAEFEEPAFYHHYLQILLFL